MALETPNTVYLHQNLHIIHTLSHHCLPPSIRFCYISSIFGAPPKKTTTEWNETPPWLSQSSSTIPPSYGANLSAPLLHLWHDLGGGMCNQMWGRRYEFVNGLLQNAYRVYIYVEWCWSHRFIDFVKFFVVILVLMSLCILEVVAGTTVWPIPFGQLLGDSQAHLGNMRLGTP